VPSKTLVHAAEALLQVAAAWRFAGLDGQARLENWRAVLRQKDELVAALRKAKYLDLPPGYNTVAISKVGPGWSVAA
jgi:mercuric reductase